LVSQSLVVSRLCFKYTRVAVFYSLSLHDALPIFYSFHHTGKNGSCHPASLSICKGTEPDPAIFTTYPGAYYQAWSYAHKPAIHIDRKSTRLNSSHVKISYAVFCLKKKNRRTTSHL